MTLTATREFGMTLAWSANPPDSGDTGWKMVDTPINAGAKYARVIELHCADLAAMPITLTSEQATALQNIMQNKLSGPRGEILSSYLPAPSSPV